MKIAVFSTKPYDQFYFDHFNTGEELPKHELTYFENALNRDTVKMAIGYEGVCVFVNDKLDRQTIESLADHDVGLIALRCAGYNNVDLQAAMEREIRVLRVPAYSPRAVAEHAAALILTLNRKTHKAYNRIREGNFSLVKLTGFDLFGKTVGVIGTGQIGAAFCRIMLGFGCKVLAADLYESEELKDAGVQYQTFEAIIQASDIISLHCPLTPSTFHLINKQVFKKMKPGAMLINTSRGALIHTRDAIKALKKGKLGYLGIDVYEEEEHLFFKDRSEDIILDDQIARLTTFPNVLITGHQAFFTKEALEEIAMTTLSNISDFAAGRSSNNEIVFKG